MPSGLARDISCSGDARNRLQLLFRSYRKLDSYLQVMMEFAKHTPISLSD